MLNQLSPADLRALRVFEAVIDAGSFAAAQDLLNVSESTISAQITGFEQRIGFRLCSRGRGGLQMTERGKVVLDRYGLLLSQMNNFRYSVNALKDQAVGNLSVGLLDHTMTEHHFSTVELIKRFVDEAPHVKLELVQDIQSNLLRAILEDRLDLAVGAFDLRSDLIDAVKLYRETQYLYCGASHPLYAKAPEVTRAQIETADWVLRGYTLSSFTSVPVTPITSTATAANIESVATILLAGHHIGYLPAHFAQGYEASGAMRKLRPDDLMVEIDFSLISRAGRRQTRAVEIFSELIQALCQSPAA